MVHTSLLVNIIYGAWYTLTRVDLECCREAALLLLVFFFFSNVLDLMWGPNSERQELFMLSVTLDVTSAPVVTITHSSCFAVTFLTIPYRPMHVSCLTKHRSFRSSTYYGLHDIVLSYMGLSHIHMHVRIHACRPSIHGTRMLGPCMFSWQAWHMYARFTPG